MMKSHSLQKRLRIKAEMIANGEKIPYGSDSEIMFEAANKIDALEKENTSLREQLAASVEPAAEVVDISGEVYTVKAIRFFVNDEALPVGTKLYTRPQPAQVSDERAEFETKAKELSGQYSIIR